MTYFLPTFWPSTYILTVDSHSHTASVTHCHPLSLTATHCHPLSSTVTLPSLHPPCTLHTLFTPSSHSLCALFALSSHSLHNLFTISLHSLHTLSLAPHGTYWHPPRLYATRSCIFYIFTSVMWLLSRISLVVVMIDVARSQHAQILYFRPLSKLLIL